MSNSGREMISLDEALDRVLASLRGRRPGVETVPLGESLGRVLAEEIVCSEDFPSADVSAMDGFVLRAVDLEQRDTLKLAGESLAGAPHAGRLAQGTCIRVMTGGLVPAGADTVVPVERTSGYEPTDEGEIRFEGKVQPGDNIRARGCVRAQGEKLLPGGIRIRPAQIGVLAQQGISEVSVGGRPRVAVLPTGDEIVEIDEKPGPGEVRNSNAHALVAQVRAAGGVPTLLPVARDREGETKESLAEALEHHDLVCTIGGVSMGTRDLVRGSFEELGGTILIESIRVKPGKPTVFGVVDRGGRKSFLLGLPGNPASSFTIFALLGAPWVETWQGMRPEEVAQRRHASLWFSKVRPNRRLQALPGRLRLRHEGVVVEEVVQKTSADLFSLGEADVIFLAPENEGPRDGDLVDWMELP